MGLNTAQISSLEQQHQETQLQYLIAPTSGPLKITLKDPDHLPPSKHEWINVLVEQESTAEDAPAHEASVVLKMGELWG